MKLWTDCFQTNDRISQNTLELIILLMEKAKSYGRVRSLLHSSIIMNWTSNFVQVLQVYDQAMSKAIQPTGAVLDCVILAKIKTGQHVNSILQLSLHAIDTRTQNEPLFDVSGFG